jgi:ribonuclease BN (tRNA processing enzyme)
MNELAAHIEFRPIPAERVQFEWGTIQALRLHHPQSCLGFRLEAANTVLVYASDNEPGDAAGDSAVRRLAQGADVLIYDAQYLPDEYLAFGQGRGHSHWREAIAIAHQCQVKQLVLFHHDPDRTDTAIDRLLAEARQQFPQVSAAAEGMTLQL